MNKFKNTKADVRWFPDHQLFFEKTREQMRVMSFEVRLFKTGLGSKLVGTVSCIEVQKQENLKLCQLTITFCMLVFFIKNKNLSLWCKFRTWVWNYAKESFRCHFPKNNTELEKKPFFSSLFCTRGLIFIDKGELFSNLCRTQYFTYFVCFFFRNHYYLYFLFRWAITI